MPGFCLFHRTTDCVSLFSKSYIHKQLSCKQMAGFPLPQLHLNEHFLIIKPSFHLSCQVPFLKLLAEITSCHCCGIFVHRAVAGGCSKTEVEDRSPSSYGQSQAVPGTWGVSW